jgi:hypothetical protein
MFNVIISRYALAAHEAAQLDTLKVHTHRTRFDNATRFLSFWNRSVKIEKSRRVVESRPACLDLLIDVFFANV